MITGTYSTGKLDFLLSLKHLKMKEISSPTFHTKEGHRRQIFTYLVFKKLR